MGWIARMGGMLGKRRLSRERLDDELREELEFHLAMREGLNREEGMTAEQARRASRLKFGNPAVMRERMRMIDVATLPETVLQDLRYGLRTLRRGGGLTLVAVCALALGIGINVAVFTAYKAFFSRSLDGRDPGRLVNTAITMQSGELWADFSYPDYEAYRDNLRSFDGLIAWQGVEMLSLTGVGDVEKNRANASRTLVGRLGLLPGTVSNAEFAGTFLVSENYFSVLGVPMMRGRAFAKSDAAPTVLISENYWKKRFGGDPGVLGRTVRLNGIAFAIVGITPHNFVGTQVEAPDFWLPTSAVPLIHPADNWLRKREDMCCRIFGRLAAGVSREQAQAEMTAFTASLKTLHDPHSDWKPTTAVVWPGSPFPFPVTHDRNLMSGVLLIMGAVVMVLVIACANVAGLQLARVASRQNELSTRLSLGASRARIVRQLLTESALLGMLAGVLALLFSWAFLQAMVVAAANEFPSQLGTIVFNVTPDLGIFAYVFCISLVAGVLFGLAPALESTHGAVATAKESTGTSSKRSRRLRNALMAVQVGISVALMIAGSMLIRSSIRALTLDTGFETRHAFELQMQWPESYAADRKLALMKELRTRVAAMPGAVAVTSGRAPDEGGMRMAAVSLNGEKPSAQNTRAVLFYTYVQANYFETLGIPLLAGRSFGMRAGEPEPGVVVSEAAAQLLWPGQNPVGRSLRLGTDRQYHGKNELVPDGRVYQVIGVARNTRGVLMDGSDAEDIYVPLPEARMQDFPIVVRTNRDEQQVMNEMGPAITAVDAEVVVTASTLEELLRVTPAFMASALAAGFASILGALGLLLASMGIYSTVSFVVVLRTREMGIRLALGAKKRQVVGLMLRQSLRPVVAGLLVGVCLALGSGYLLRKILYGVGAVDGVSFVGVSAAFLAIALLAAYVPSRRATKVNPVEALRCE